MVPYSSVDNLAVVMKAHPLYEVETVHYYADRTKAISHSSLDLRWLHVSRFVFSRLRDVYVTMHDKRELIPSRVAGEVRYFSDEMKLVFSHHMTSHLVQLAHCTTSMLFDQSKLSV